MPHGSQSQTRQAPRLLPLGFGRMYRPSSFCDRIISFVRPKAYSVCRVVIVNLPRVKGSQPYIAVVDDEPAVLKALERLFRSAKIEVATFASGAAFLASTEIRQPDCVVLDLHMPEMNGFDVLSRLSACPGKKV